MKIRTITCGFVALFATIAQTFSSFAAAVPDPVDGVITIDISSATTYDTALPAATKLVKKGAGTATLTVDSTAFTGKDGVIVEGGTLKITTYGAVGTAQEIVVSNNATFLLNTPGKAQGDSGYFKRNVTISGKGASGMNGALVFQCNGGSSMTDNLFNDITLLADAKIHVTSRAGLRNLQLNGHTLDIGGSANSPMLVCATLFAGNFNVLNGGCLSLSDGSKVDGGCTAANSRIDVRGGGLLSLWKVSPVIPHDITFHGDCLDGKGNVVYGRFSCSDKKGSDYNRFSGRVDVVSEIAPTGSGTATWKADFGETSVTDFRTTITLLGEFSISNNWNKSNGSTLSLAGRVLPGAGSAEKPYRLVQINGGNIEFLDGSQVVYGEGKEGLYLAAYNNGSGAAYFKGGDNVLYGLDPTYGGGATAPTFVMSGGKLAVKKLFRLGHGGEKLGAFLLSGGELTTCGFGFANADTTTERPNPGRAVFEQTGGRMTVSSDYCFLGNRGYGVMSVRGGTNDQSNATEIRMACESATATATLEVAGEDTRFAASGVKFGYQTAAGARAVIAVRDGGTFASQRLRSYGKRTGYSEGNVPKCLLYADGGIVKPRLGYGWNEDSNYYYPRFVLGPRGVTIDTSESVNADGVSPLASTILCPVEQASGKGIATITLPTSSDFTSLTYYAPAVIDIEGVGEGAAAYAELTADKTLNVRIVSPGCDYDETTKVYIWNPLGTQRFECGYTLADNARGGGLTKRGDRQLSLKAVSTYTGPTVVEEGELKASVAGAIPNGSAVTVAKGASLVSSEMANLTVPSVGGAGMLQNWYVTVSEGGRIRVSTRDLADGTAALHFTQNLTLSKDVAVEVTDPENLATLESGDALKVLETTSWALIKMDGPLKLLPESLNEKWKLKVKAHDVWLSPRKGVVLIVR